VHRSSKKRSHGKDSHTSKNRDLWNVYNKLRKEQAALMQEQKYLVHEIKNFKNQNAQMTTQNALWQADADRLAQAQADVAKFTRVIASEEIVANDLRDRVKVLPQVLEENAELIAQVEKLNLGIADLKNQIVSLTSTIAGLNKTIEDLTVIANQADGLRVQIDGLNAQIADQEAKISALKQQLTSAQDTITNLRADVQTLNQQLSDKKNVTRALWNELNDAKGVITALDKELTWLTKQVEGKNLQIGKLRDTWNQNNFKIQSLQSQIVSLKQSGVERDELARQSAQLRNLLVELKAKLGWSKKSQGSLHSRRNKKGILVGSA
jgi:chromosome segregation ATPase